MPATDVLTRRRLVAALAAAATTPLLTACRNLGLGASTGGKARLKARPGTVTTAVGAGTFPLGLGDFRDGLLFVPAGYAVQSPAPLLLSLHGAGGSADGPIQFLSAEATSRGVVVVAPESRGPTWDAIRGVFGPDVAFIDRVLASVFSQVAIDPQRIFIEGFSDGASYTLALALANGDLFHRAVAFSPGFIPQSDSPVAGHAEFFISHGRQDPVLPIDQSSRVIVPGLRRSGFTVEYVEFDGVHTIPADIATQSMQWLFR